MDVCRQPQQDQTYCDRLVQDTPFLTGQGRLSEQQVDRIILQLNRYYPQILTNKEAEKFRNPKASLRVRLCDLLSHLQQCGERHCQEFYRALYIHAQPLHSHLPSRYTLQNSDCRELDWGSESRELSDRGPMSFLAGLGLAAGLALILYCCPPGLTSLNPLRPAACSKPRLLYFLCPVMPESVIRGGLGDRARYGLLRPYPLKAWGSPRQELMISGARTSSDLSSPKQGPCTPKCCLGPDASLPSHLSSSTGMLAATCWPSWQMTSEGSDGPRPWALPAT
ncbi:caspase recruitment domain-containing protein 19 isoform X1 [Cricetulus griseus]|uniref:caspase recruitment domain-containing protein 19 isoform X1 n=1 Tax=Cricetulus griseus TaxID=10029 RepID=UPI000F736635|nr:caspase recruitment domain-containing protein 19 isoform X1 [Cricetulus griseus]